MAPRVLITGGALVAGFTALALTGCRAGGDRAATAPKAETRSTETLPPSPVPAAASSPYQGPGTRRMAALLEDLARKANPKSLFALNGERAALIRAEMSQTTDPHVLRGLMAYYAVELRNGGKTEESLRTFQAYIHRMGEADPAGLKNLIPQLRQEVTLTYLRMGEEQNCCAGNNADSCLLPIRGEGIHRIQTGSRQAIRLLTETLQASPDDLSARWLLNIAYMTLGEYPQKVPRQWRIPPSAFRSDYDIKRFPNVAGKVGLDINGLSGGGVLDDFDGDGDLDLMISSLGLRDPLRFFRNNGDGSFTERTEEAGLTGEVGGLNLIQGDCNNDGYPDVLILRGGWFREDGKLPNSLLRNNGDGTFEDVTEAAGLLSFHPTQTAVWFDYNGDGWLDIFIGNETADASKAHPCELYRNNGNGTFTECAAECGLNQVGYVKAVVAGDYNNDGRPDLYLSRFKQTNLLFRNDGPRGPDASPKATWKFTDVSERAGVARPLESFPACFFDYDNDGRLDLFVCSYPTDHNAIDVAADYLRLPTSAERNCLYHNNGDGTFTDVTRAAGLYKVVLGMSLNYGDLDNDGWLDLYVGTGNPDFTSLVPNRMFRNAGGRRFQEVTTSGDFGHLQKGHAISFGDIDNDGDQDVYTVMGGAYQGDVARNALFQNPGHGNHWISLKLQGVRSNRPAVGARIRVIVATANGVRSIYKTVGSGGSFGASPLRQEIGLGRATAIRAVEIFWPATGKTQVVRGLRMDRWYTIREGGAGATPISLRPFRLGPRAPQTAVAGG